MKPTKWQVLEALETELREALPEIAHRVDVDIHEAHYDRFSKDYNKFHEVESEEFDMEKLLKRIKAAAR